MINACPPPANPAETLVRRPWERNAFGTLLSVAASSSGSAGWGWGPSAWGW
jgi:hypothetical protein